MSSTSTDTAQAATAGVHTFVSRSDLRPPVVTTTATGSLSGLPEYVFLGNKPYKGPTGVGQEGLLIARRDGDITWFSPITSGQVLDFNLQTYRGKSVLTWWHGETSTSYGQGTCYIADSSYSVIAKSGSSLAAVATQARSGFETVIAANSVGPYFAVTAHDSTGKLIGQSATVRKTGLTAV